MMSALALGLTHSDAVEYRRCVGASGIERGADDDEVLVVAIARGDKQALGRLYDRYAAALLGVAMRMLRERRECEDLVHDVFLEAWQKARDFDPERGSVRAWLFMRLRSRALDRLKAAGYARVDSLEERDVRARVEVASVGDEGGEAADHAAVRALVDALPDEQRRVLELGYFEGLSSSEIAARLGLPLGTVKSRVAAAMARLRSAFGIARGAGAVGGGAS
jgi:RNA polymerase sigma-70 factor (ECF subfamily)